MKGIAGGKQIDVTTDGGTTWKGVKTKPPGSAPYQALAISPFDGSVWFFVHAGKLLRTRDGSLTWHEVAGLPALANPLLAVGATLGQFYLASGGRTFELIDNGQQISELPRMPLGVAATQMAAMGGSQPAIAARGSDGGFYLLSGTSWSRVGSAPAGPIAAGNGTLVIGDGGGKLGTAGRASYSTDGGTTWKDGSGLPLDQSVEAVAGLPSSLTFFAYCYGGDVFKSTDGGKDWTVFSMGLRTRSG